jgi:hypothetical protein
MTVFTEIKKSIQNHIRKHKRPQIAKAILAKKSNTRGIKTLNFKLYYRAITIKNSMVFAQKQTGKPMDSNRRPRYKPTLLQLNDFLQRSPKHTMEKKTSSTMLLGNWIFTCRRLKLDLCLSSGSKIN